MRTGRKEELIACCRALERLADKLTDEWGLDQTLEIKITFLPLEPAEVSVSKKIIPREVVKVLSGKDYGP